MKFSATFAVLAVFVANAVVSATPFHPETDAVEARAEFAGSALEDVWERYYDDLLDEVDAREFEEDLFEARDFEDEIFERSPQMKKFAGDLASGLAQKIPAMSKQYQQGQSFQHRQSQPTFQQAMAAKNKPAPKPAGTKKRSFDDEELVERQIKKFASDLAIGLGQKAPGYAKQYSQGVAFQNRQKLPTFQQSMAAKKSSTGGKKRSFDDDELVERQIKKFAGDLAIGLAQKAPGYAKQYSQGVAFQNRQKLPTFQQSMAAKKSSSGGKKRSFDDDELVERQIKKFASDLAIGLGQKAPGYAKQYSQGVAFQNRQKLPTFQQSMAAKKSSSGGKKRSFDDDELVERQIKKFAGDLAIGLAQKAPGYAKQYSQGVAFQNRQKLPTFQQSMAAKKSSTGGKK